MGRGGLGRAGMGRAAGAGGGGGGGARGARNVRLAMALVAASGVADSVWSAAVLSAYLFLLERGSNRAVGLAEALSGAATLLTALPVGFLADKYSRAGVIAGGGVVMLAAAGVTLYALLDVAGGRAYAAICGAMALWGVGGGIVTGPMQALFADSVPRGERSRAYTRLFSAWLVPSCVGPAISAAMFARIGDSWTLEQLRPIFLTGIALEVPVAVLMFFFRDMAQEEGEASGDEAPAEGGGKGETGAAEPAEAPEWAGAGGAATSWGCLGRKHIPVVMFASDLLVSLGAGMTVKFFPLYFKSNVGLSPMHTQLIYVVVPLVMAAFAGAAQRASRVLGRAQVMVLFRLTGVACLGAMVLLAEVARCERWEVMVPIYLVRTALMNSVTPVEQSLLMDCVPKNTRARWKSLESVMQFGWCGSAVLGGVIADKFKNTDRSGYTQTFAFTCALQLAGTLIGLLLLPLVPRQERPRSGGGADPLREPLLSEGGESPHTAQP